uniref:Uncharacterized protein n=1 Tax=Pararge aegeria TaxID=116150 RepID=S4P8X4_9NEOP
MTGLFLSTNLTTNGVRCFELRLFSPYSDLTLAATIDGIAYSVMIKEVANMIGSVPLVGHRPREHVPTILP